MGTTDKNIILLSLSLCLLSKEASGISWLCSFLISSRLMHRLWNSFSSSHLLFMTQTVSFLPPPFDPNLDMSGEGILRITLLLMAKQVWGSDCSTYRLALSLPWLIIRVVSQPSTFRYVIYISSPRQKHVDEQL